MKPDTIVRIQIGCTASRDKDDLAYVRQQTHDWLIEEVGDARVAPVEWRHWTAPNGVWVLHDIGLDQDSVGRDAVRFLRANPSGMLVVASVEVDVQRLPEDQRVAAIGEVSDAG